MKDERVNKAEVDGQSEEVELARHELRPRSGGGEGEGVGARHRRRAALRGEREVDGAVLVLLRREERALLAEGDAQQEEAWLGEVQQERLGGTEALPGGRDARLGANCVVQERRGPVGERGKPKRMSRFICVSFSHSESASGKRRERVECVVISSRAPGVHP